MRFSQSATELTTAATDAVLGVVYVAVSVHLLATRTSDPWKKALWIWVLALAALGALLGAAVHGLTLSEATRAAIWQALYLSLGVTVALFFIGALYDWRGESMARASLPWAVATGCAFFWLTQFYGGPFFIFLLYEAAAMLGALAMYARLALGGTLAGAGIVAAGIGLNLAAAAVQTSSLSVRLVVPFDHNGLFHIVQLIATFALAGGLRRGLAVRTTQTG